MPPLILNGDTGISGVDGSAGTPSYQGNDSNTGVFFPAADTIAFAEGGVEVARFDSSGNLGIGTSSPSAKLDVRGNMWVRQSDGSYFNFTSTSTVADIEFSNTPALRFVYNAVTEVMRMNSSGNVGIGTSSPSATLDVRNTSNEQIRFGYTGTPNYCSLGRNSGTGNFNIFVNSAEPLLFGTSNTERMRITSAGDVLIGTTAQFGSAKVTMQTSGGAVDTLALYSPSTTNGAVLRLADNNFNCAIRSAPVGGATNLAFDVTGAERMRIDSSGNVVVGGTAVPNNTSNRGNLVINGTNDSIINLTNGNSTTEGGYLYFSGTNLELKSGRTSSTVRVIALTNGVVLNNGATSWSAISDERTKDIIEPITDGLNKIASIRPVIGKYKTDEEGTRRSFLIAQDVQAVLPEAVVAQDDEIGTLTLSYTDTIPLLVAAIQEQQAMIEELKQEVALLKGA